MESKTALVTGASRGIGKAAAGLLADEGAEIIACARSLEQLTALKNGLEKTGARIQIVPLDLSSSRQIEELFEFIRARYDCLDTVINAAGVFEAASIESIDEQSFDRIISVNLKAPLLICRNAIPLLEKSRCGTIVNISSLSGCFGLEKFPGFGAYDISKYGLWGLTEILAVELKGRNIRVNQVSPGGVDTEMFYQANGPAARPSLSPRQVARTILYLASDQSMPMTGENIKLMG